MLNMKALFYRFRNYFFSYGERTLLEYECACLYGFWMLLGEEGRNKLEKQFLLYDRVQRSPNGRHLAFFDDESDGLCLTWAKADLFPFTGGPRAVASLSLAGTGKSKKVTAEIFFYAGRFAGIEFDRGIKSLMANAEVPIKGAKISSFGAYADLLKGQVMLLDPMENEG